VPSFPLVIPMSLVLPRVCRCPACCEEADHPDKQHHRRLNALMPLLSRQQRRLFAAIESSRLGRGNDLLVSRITGLSPAAIRLGRRQLSDLAQGKLPERRRPAGGRPLTETKNPALVAFLQKMVDEEIAGDPMRNRAWVRSSTAKLANKLREQGFKTSPMTVWRLLKRMGFSMKTNIRKRRGNRPDSPERDEQFRYITAKRGEYLAAGWPVISIDTKKKELIGNFRNTGRAWCRNAPEVSEHDFPSEAECRAVPFGVYDLARNRGTWSWGHRTTPRSSR
jgi:hypothetical protein